MWGFSNVTFAHSSSSLGNKLLARHVTGLVFTLLALQELSPSTIVLTVNGPEVIVPLLLERAC
jgi:hypothetical protein